MKGGTIRELHLFAGAGGGIVGSILCGHSPVCAVEIEPYCRQVLLQRQRDGILPVFPIWDDVRTFDGNPWRGRVDLVAGGFPCQDISAAGKGAGIDGERSGLWREMARIIGEVGPDLSGWKTARCLFIEDLPESSVTLPGWGLMQGGEFWGLMMQGHPKEEKGSGSLVTFPTPKASEDKWGTDSNGTPSLGKMALDGLWPTPRTTGLDGGSNSRKAAKERGMWPTPTASQHKGWAANHNRADTDDRLDYTVEREANQNQPGDKARLNPDWVEWLMGWPIGWTSLEPLQGATIPSWTHDPGETGEVPRAAHKIKSRVARLKAIGNGQVPQVVNLAWCILSAGIVESCN